MRFSPVDYPKKVRWILSIFLGVAFAQSFDLPGTVRQGSVLRIHGSGTAVAARMNGRTIRLFRQEDGVAFGLMPIAADQKPGAYDVELLDQAGATVATK